MLDAADEHWLHEHEEEAVCLLELVGSCDEAGYVRVLMERMLADVASCPQCVIAYHRDQVSKSEGKSQR